MVERGDVHFEVARNLSAERTRERRSISASEETNGLQTRGEGEKRTGRIRVRGVGRSDARNFKLNYRKCKFKAFTRLDIFTQRKIPFENLAFVSRSRIFKSKTMNRAKSERVHALYRLRNFHSFVRLFILFFSMCACLQAILTSVLFVRQNGHCFSSVIYSFFF